MTTRRQNVRTRRQDALAAELEEEERLATEAAKATQSNQERAENPASAPIETASINPPINKETQPSIETMPVALTTSALIPDPATQHQTKPGIGEISELDGGEGEDDMLFEDLYKRETYYIRKSNIPRLKKLLKKMKKRPGRSGHTKYELMDEALEYLFQKYDIK